MSYDTYKESLTGMLTELTVELKKIGIHNPDNPSDWVPVPESDGRDETDPDLVADAGEAWEERQALVAALERQYNDINRALTKIAEGTYGKCEIGDEPIEEDRLEANPSARTCKAHMDDEVALDI